RSMAVAALHAFPGTGGETARAATRSWRPHPLVVPPRTRAGPSAVPYHDPDRPGPPGRSHSQGPPMRVPLSWLPEDVPLPDDTAHLVERLTLAGLEAAGAQVFGLPVPPGLQVKPADAGLDWERDKVVLAKVLEITKHPNADTLKLVKLDHGAAEPKTV